MTSRVVTVVCRAGVAVGAGLVVAGVALWWPPAALVVAGVALAGGCLLALGVRP